MIGPERLAMTRLICLATGGARSDFNDQFTRHRLVKKKEAWGGL